MIFIQIRLQRRIQSKLNQTRVFLWFLLHTTSVGEYKLFILFLHLRRKDLFCLMFSEQR